MRWFNMHSRRKCGVIGNTLGECIGNTLGECIENLGNIIGNMY
jgi:hypothetical protein